MLTQRQAQVQRSPTERFALAIRDYVDERLRNKGPLYDADGEEAKALARMEDAFNDAVEAKINSLQSDYGVPDLVYPNLDCD